jgi:phage/plasmid-like protein (TIGR03299 family)
MNVNDQFAAERAAQLATLANRREWLDSQVAAGEMRKNGNGTYTVLGTGWDRGETFNAMGLPETGLETLANGDKAFYGAGKPAWWSIGTPIPRLAKSTTEILGYAGLDFEVGIKPTPWIMQDGEITALDGSFTTYRIDMNGHETPFGTVGKRYVPLAPREAFGMLDEISDYLPVETAGMWKGGRRMFVSCKAPEPVTLDPSGIADKVDMYLNLTNSWAGESNVSADVSPWRRVCKNTNRFAIRDATATFQIRHTASMMDKIEEAKRALGLTEDYAAKWAAEETALINTPFAANQVDALINQVYGELAIDAGKRAVTLRGSLRDDVHKWWEVESERAGANAYAAENAITGHEDHGRNYRNGGTLTPLAALGEAILAESAEPVKSKAHAKLMLITRNR